MASKEGKISLKPGNMKGLGQKKAPKLLGGKKAPAVLLKALGVGTGVNLHPMMLGKLVGHPDPKVRSAAKKLLGGF